MDLNDEEDVDNLNNTEEVGQSTHNTNGNEQASDACAVARESFPIEGNDPSLVDQSTRQEPEAYFKKDNDHPDNNEGITILCDNKQQTDDSIQEEQHRERRSRNEQHAVGNSEEATQEHNICSKNGQELRTDATDEKSQTCGCPSEKDGSGEVKSDSNSSERNAILHLRDIIPNEQSGKRSPTIDTPRTKYNIEVTHLDLVDGLSSSANKSRSLSTLPSIEEGSEENSESPLINQYTNPPVSSSLTSLPFVTSHFYGNVIQGVSSKPTLTSIKEESRISFADDGLEQIGDEALENVPMEWRVVHGSKTDDNINSQEGNFLLIEANKGYGDVSSNDVAMDIGSKIMDKKNDFPGGEGYLEFQSKLKDDFDAIVPASEIVVNVLINEVAGNVPSREHNVQSVDGVGLRNEDDGGGDERTISTEAYRDCRGGNIGDNMKCCKTENVTENETRSEVVEPALDVDESVREELQYDEEDGRTAIDRDIEDSQKDNGMNVEYDNEVDSVTDQSVSDVTTVIGTKENVTETLKGSEHSLNDGMGTSSPTGEFASEQCASDLNKVTRLGNDMCGNGPMVCMNDGGKSVCPQEGEDDKKVASFSKAKGSGSDSKVNDTTSSSCDVSMARESHSEHTVSSTISEKQDKESNEKESQKQRDKDKDRDRDGNKRKRERGAEEGSASVEVKECLKNAVGDVCGKQSSNRNVTSGPYTCEIKGSDTKATCRLEWQITDLANDSQNGESEMNRLIQHITENSHQVFDSIQESDSISDSLKQNKPRSKKRKNKRKKKHVADPSGAAVDMSCQNNTQASQDTETDTLDTCDSSNCIGSPLSVSQADDFTSLNVDDQVSQNGPMASSNLVSLINVRNNAGRTQSGQSNENAIPESTICPNFTPDQQGNHAIPEWAESCSGEVFLPANETQSHLVTDEEAAFLSVTNSGNEKYPSANETEVPTINDTRTGSVFFSAGAPSGEGCSRQNEMPIGQPPKCELVLKSLEHSRAETPSFENDITDTEFRFVTAMSNSEFNCAVSQGQDTFASADDASIGDSRSSIPIPESRLCNEVNGFDRATLLVRSDYNKDTEQCDSLLSHSSSSDGTEGYQAHQNGDIPDDSPLLVNEANAILIKNHESKEAPRENRIGRMVENYKNSQVALETEISSLSGVDPDEDTPVTQEQCLTLDEGQLVSSPETTIHQESSETRVEPEQNSKDSFEITVDGTVECEGLIISCESEKLLVDCGTDTSIGEGTQRTESVCSGCGNEANIECRREESLHSILGSNVLSEDEDKLCVNGKDALSEKSVDTEGKREHDRQKDEDKEHCLLKDSVSGGDEGQILEESDPDFLVSDKHYLCKESDEIIPEGFEKQRSDTSIDSEWKQRENDQTEMEYGEVKASARKEDGVDTCKEDRANLHGLSDETVSGRCNERIYCNECEGNVHDSSQEACEDISAIEDKDSQGDKDSACERDNDLLHGKCEEIVCKDDADSEGIGYEKHENKSREAKKSNLCVREQDINSVELEYVGCVGEEKDGRTGDEHNAQAKIECVECMNDCNEFVEGGENECARGPGLAYEENDISGAGKCEDGVCMRNQNVILGGDEHVQCGEGERNECLVDEDSVHAQSEDVEYGEREDGVRIGDQKIVNGEGEDSQCEERGDIECEGCERNECIVDQDGLHPEGEYVENKEGEDSHNIVIGEGEDIELKISESVESGEGERKVSISSKDFACGEGECVDLGNDEHNTSVIDENEVDGEGEYTECNEVEDIEHREVEEKACVGDQDIAYRECENINCDESVGMEDNVTRKEDEDKAMAEFEGETCIDGKAYTQTANSDIEESTCKNDEVDAHIMEVDDNACQESDRKNTSEEIKGHEGEGSDEKLCHEEDGIEAADGKEDSVCGDDDEIIIYENEEGNTRKEHNSDVTEEGKVVECRGCEDTGWGKRDEREECEVSADATQNDGLLEKLSNDVEETMRGPWDETEGEERVSEVMGDIKYYVETGDMHIEEIEESGGKLHEERVKEENGEQLCERIEIEESEEEFGEGTERGEAGDELDEGIEKEESGEELERIEKKKMGEELCEGAERGESGEELDEGIEKKKMGEELCEQAERGESGEELDEGIEKKKMGEELCEGIEIGESREKLDEGKEKMEMGKELCEGTEMEENGEELDEGKEKMKMGKELCEGTEMEESGEELDEGKEKMKMGKELCEGTEMEESGEELDEGIEKMKMGEELCEGIEIGESREKLDEGKENMKIGKELCEGTEIGEGGENLYEGKEKMKMGKELCEGTEMEESGEELDEVKEKLKMGKELCEGTEMEESGEELDEGKEKMKMGKELCEGTEMEESGEELYEGIEKMKMGEELCEGIEIGESGEKLDEGKEKMKIGKELCEGTEIGEGGEKLDEGKEKMKMGKELYEGTEMEESGEKLDEGKEKMKMGKELCEGTEMEESGEELYEGIEKMKMGEELCEGIEIGESGEKLDEGKEKMKIGKELCEGTEIGEGGEKLDEGKEKMKMGKELYEGTEMEESGEKLGEGKEKMKMGKELCEVIEIGESGEELDAGKEKKKMGEELCEGIEIGESGEKLDEGKEKMKIGKELCEGTEIGEGGEKLDEGKEKMKMGKELYEGTEMEESGEKLGEGKEKMKMGKELCEVIEIGESGEELDAGKEKKKMGEELCEGIEIGESREKLDEGKEKMKIGKELCEGTEIGESGEKLDEGKEKMKMGKELYEGTEMEEGGEELKTSRLEEECLNVKKENVFETETAESVDKLEEKRLGERSTYEIECQQGESVSKESMESYENDMENAEEMSDNEKESVVPDYSEQNSDEDDKGTENNEHEEISDEENAVMPELTKLVNGAELSLKDESSDELSDTKEPEDGISKSAEDKRESESIECQLKSDGESNLASKVSDSIGNSDNGNGVGIELDTDEVSNIDSGDKISKLLITENEKQGGDTLDEVINKHKNEALGQDEEEQDDVSSSMVGPGGEKVDSSSNKDHVPGTSSKFIGIETDDEDTEIQDEDNELSESSGTNDSHSGGATCDSSSAEHSGANEIYVYDETDMQSDETRPKDSAQENDQSGFERNELPVRHNEENVRNSCYEEVNLSDSDSFEKNNQTSLGEPSASNEEVGLKDESEDSGTSESENDEEMSCAETDRPDENVPLADNRVSDDRCQDGENREHDETDEPSGEVVKREIYENQHSANEDSFEEYINGLVSQPTVVGEMNEEKIEEYRGELDENREAQEEEESERKGGEKVCVIEQEHFGINPTSIKNYIIVNEDYFKASTAKAICKSSSTSDTELSLEAENENAESPVVPERVENTTSRLELQRRDHTEEFNSYRPRAFEQDSWHYHSENNKDDARMSRDATTWPNGEQMVESDDSWRTERRENKDDPEANETTAENTHSKTDNQLLHGGTEGLPCHCQWEQKKQQRNAMLSQSGCGECITDCILQDQQSQTHPREMEAAEVSETLAYCPADFRAFDNSKEQREESEPQESLVTPPSTLDMSVNGMVKNEERMEEGLTSEESHQLEGTPHTYDVQEEHLVPNVIILNDEPVVKYHESKDDASEFDNCPFEIHDASVLTSDAHVEGMENLPDADTGGFSSNETDASRIYSNEETSNLEQTEQADLHDKEYDDHISNIEPSPDEREADEVCLEFATESTGPVLPIQGHTDEQEVQPIDASGVSLKLNPTDRGENVLECGTDMAIENETAMPDTFGEESVTNALASYSKDNASADGGPEPTLPIEEKPEEILELIDEVLFGHTGPADADDDNGDDDLTILPEEGMSGVPSARMSDLFRGGEESVDIQEGVPDTDVRGTESLITSADRFEKDPSPHGGNEPTAVLPPPVEFRNTDSGDLTCKNAEGCEGCSSLDAEPKPVKVDAPSSSKIKPLWRKVVARLQHPTSHRRSSAKHKKRAASECATGACQQGTGQQAPNGQDETNDDGWKTLERHSLPLSATKRRFSQAKSSGYKSEWRRFRRLKRMRSGAEMVPDKLVPTRRPIGTRNVHKLYTGPHTSYDNMDSDPVVAGVNDRRSKGKTRKKRSDLLLHGHLKEVEITGEQTPFAKTDDVFEVYCDQEKKEVSDLAESLVNKETPPIRLLMKPLMSRMSTQSSQSKDKETVTDPKEATELIDESVRTKTRPSKRISCVVM